jgi:hypothetical protein
MSEQNTNVPRLEPKHLYEKRIQRDSSRLKAYNQILSQIQNRIFQTSQLSETANYIMYNVPPFVLGLPAIDMEHCIIYIVHMLRQNGFVVRYTYPNLLHISWKHYEAQYNREHNPITQAMKPPSSTSKKGKEGKRGNEITSGVTFATTPSLLGPTQAPQRSTAEYSPPDSFLQGITRPAQKPLNTVLPASAQPGPSETTSNVIADLWKFV